MGACSYVLSEAVDGSFKVIVTNVPCGTSGLTCTKAVRITVPGYSIYLMKGAGKLTLLIYDVTYHFPL